MGICQTRTRGYSKGSLTVQKEKKFRHYKITETGQICQDELSVPYLTTVIPNNSRFQTLFTVSSYFFSVTHCNDQPLYE